MMHPGLPGQKGRLKEPSTFMMTSPGNWASVSNHPRHYRQSDISEMGQRNTGKGSAATIGTAIDFLGYSFDREKVLLRKRIKQTFARKMARIKSKRRRHAVLAAYWGWCKWGNCRNLWNKLTDNNMSFAEKGIIGRSTTKDGKKFFDVTLVRADDIINVPIEVIDFIPDVDTREGGGRYVIKIKRDGTECKFITNSFTLKSMLDQAKERGLIPSEEGIHTVLRKRDIGCGKKDFIFD